MRHHRTRLLVRVSRRGEGDERAYIVEMWLDGGRRVNAQEELQLDDYVESQLSSATSLAAHGLDLFNRLFSGQLSVAFQQAWASAVARERMLWCWWRATAPQPRAAAP